MPGLTSWAASLPSAGSAACWAAIVEKFDTRIARVLLNETTGVTIETDINQYLPNTALRRFIHQRDGTCRFPGCARTARRFLLTRSTLI